MLSTKGSISTNVAMVECAAGQNTKSKDVFLLSELEKVWVTVAILVHRRLLSGRSVQIAGLGSLWTKEKVLTTDPQRRRYTVRKLHFSINHSFAIRYGVDTAKVEIEKINGGYSKITTADIVSACGIPAKTISAALKEFISYIGEGLYRGRVFSIHLPGVATLLIKQSLAKIITAWELQEEFFNMDSRRWPTEMQTFGFSLLQREAQAFATEVDTDDSTRPSTGLRAADWRAHTPATDNNNNNRQKFLPAGPTDRLFSEIAEEDKKRREQKRREALQARAASEQQGMVNRRIRHYDCLNLEEEEEMEDEDTCPVHRHHRHVCDTQRPSDPRHHTRAPAQRLGDARAERPRESVYDLVPHAETPEPVIEAVEEIVSVGTQTPADTSRDDVPQPLGRALERKDRELERILRDEEPFSRPISRQSYQHSSVRDLLYGGDKAEAPKRETGPQEVDANVPRFGRKRFDAAQDTQARDHVKSLLTLGS